MTHEEFFEKLTFPGLPFTGEDAARLESWGYESALDAFGTMTETAKYESRDFVCNRMWDEASNTEDFNRVFAPVIGRELTQDEFLTLANRMNDEW